MAGALWQFHIDKEIGDFHLMSIHAKRFEAVSSPARTRNSSAS